MSQGTDDAHSSFTTAMVNARNLIDIHKDLNPGPGRRVREDSLNRSVVVLTVAAWQTFVERLTIAIVESLAPPATDPTAGVYELLAASVRNQVSRLNTPNADNTLALFGSVNFNPEPLWAVTVRFEVQRSTAAGGVLTKTATLAPGQARAELDTWLEIRHKIAHGDHFPRTARVMRLLTGSPKAGPSIKRSNADRCTRFFTELTAVTAAEAHRLHP